MYDFVVVGVGPAGARFARRAAEAGYDVLALEKGDVGTPLACSGHVSTDVWEFVPDEARERLFQNRVYGANFRIGGPDTRAYPFYKTEEVSNVIDRVELDRTLADCAREAGADVREGYTVTGVEEHSDRVIVTASVAGTAQRAQGSQAEPGDNEGQRPSGNRTQSGDSEASETPRAAGERGDSDERTFEARMVAGCDGPVSRVRREVGLPEPDEKLHGVLAFDDEADHGDFVDVHLTVPRFFAWRIPRGDAGVEYGLAAPPGREVNEMFGALTGAYDVNTERFCSGVIPIGPADRVTGHRTVLVGDAAAQTKPFTGGGILYGMTAADCAVRAIDPDDPATLRDYEAAWREALSTEIRLGRWVRRAYSLPEPVQRLGLRTLSGEIGVHMDRPTSFFSATHLRKLLSRSS